CGIIIDGSFISDWNTHEIDTSNKVNGKPVYYYRNQNGGTVPSPAGQVILANCTGMTVENLDVSTASRGIQLGFSSYNTVKNNNASGNAREGIFLVSSHCNTITNNNASGNSYGIYLWYSSNNTITNNNASGNSWDGISLYASSNNNLTYNWICNNAHCGVSITSGSTGNIIHHNNFIGNGATALRYLSQGVSNDTPNGAKGVNGNSQAYDSVGGNYWYDNTAHEGNYWSNWDGQGWGSPDAYPIDGGAGASDWYPLNGPVVPECSKFLLVALLTLYLFGLVAVRKRQK
ncbi:MAG: NosD domain-containing protein, partial [Thermoplasmata archaeon]